MIYKRGFFSSSKAVSAILKNFQILILILLVLILFNLSGINALSMSCNLSPTCAYPAVPVIYVQNESGGFDNSHAQNSSLISLQGLLAWYKLDNSSFVGENDSRVYDWSGFANNGTPNNGAIETSSGKYRGAYSFDGINDYIIVNSSVAPTVPYSVSFWFYTGVDDVSTGYVPLGLNGSNFPLFRWGFGLNKMLIYSGGEKYRYSNVISSPLNTWHHFVGVISSTNVAGLHIYIDGAASDGTTGADTGTFFYPGTNWTIGGPGSPFNGTIDEIMIFNRTLSSSEVSTLYSRSYPIYNSAVCCNSSDSNLSNSCSQTNILRLSNFSNAHVQLPTYSGSAYSYNACLSDYPGKIVCNYPTSSCSSGYQCLGSIASPDSPSTNQTNSHFGNCNEYYQKVCCKLFSPTAIQNAVLNSTLGTNLSSENLSVYFNESSIESTPYTNITDWRLNSSSIAVINMPFDSNISDTSTGAIKDYSTFGNNGTLAGTYVPKWNSLGKVGGGYYFYGNNGSSYISVSDTRSLNFENNSNFSFFAWVKTDPFYNANASGWIIAKHGGYNAGQGYQLHAQYSGVDMNKPLCNIGKSGGISVIGSTLLNDSLWHFVGCSRSGNNLSVIVDGRYESSSVSTTVTWNTSSTLPLQVGDLQPSYFDSGSDWKGWIDQVYIFNKSLSASEVKEIYDSGIANKSVQRMLSSELVKGQNWSVAITPNDYIVGDGTTVLTNNLIINNSAPTVTLVSPADNNDTTNRTPLFTWTGYDADNDPLTYTINLTAFRVSGASTCSDVIIVSTGSNNYSIPSSDLKCLSDNNMVYKWSVKANDGTIDGPWSAIRTLNISSLLALSLPVSGVSFGNMAINQANDTTTGYPAPIVIQNDGNSFANINISSSDLWASAASPTIYYRYRIWNNTGENGSFSWASSVTTPTNMPSASTSAISMLNYSDSTDSARVDIYVQVPPSEPPAFRNSTITFYGVLGES